MVKDPIRGDHHVLVLCDVLDPTGAPHATNTRAPLAAILDEEIIAEEPLYGFEQEYTMMKDGTVFGWPAVCLKITKITKFLPLGAVQFCL